MKRRRFAATSVQSNPAERSNRGIESPRLPATCRLCSMRLAARPSSEVISPPTSTRCNLPPGPPAEQIARHGVHQIGDFGTTPRFRWHCRQLHQFEPSRTSALRWSPRVTLAAELLGVPDEASVRSATANLGASGDNRAQVITLALVLGALEARTPKDAWRNANTSLGANGHWSRSVTSAEYAEFLKANGYTLSQIEQVSTGELTADEVLEAEHADEG